MLDSGKVERTLAEEALAAPFGRGMGGVFGQTQTNLGCRHGNPDTHVAGALRWGVSARHFAYWAFAGVAR